MVFNSSGTEETVRNNEKKKLIGKVRKLKIFFARVVKYDIIFIYFKTKKKCHISLPKQPILFKLHQNRRHVQTKNLKGDPMYVRGRIGITHSER